MKNVVMNENETIKVDCKCNKAIEGESIEKTLVEKG